MFNFMKKNNNNIINFVKKADIEIATAYRTNNVSALKNFMSVSMFQSMRQDVAAHKANNDDKYEAEEFMSREYSVLDENEDICVIRRDIAFKTLKHFSKRFCMGIDFSEIITVDKKNMNIMSIAAA